MKIEERHNPVGKCDYLSLQHVERYRFALQYLMPGMRVLDIACGAGYGSAMFKQAGCEVIGGDYDKDILAYAEKEWAGIRFEKAYALNLPFEDEAFDAVVSFETIEHVHNGERFLSEMRRVLKPEGIFICSTPNIRYTAHPPFHVYEYEPEEFNDLVQRQFYKVERWAQYFQFNDRLHDLISWKVLPAIVKCLERIHLKKIIKRFLKRDDICERVDQSAISGEKRQSQNYSPKGVEQYRVRKMVGERMLRIMLIVARKAA